MTRVPLLQTSRVAAEATVARLREVGIDAEVWDRPGLFTKLTSGGNYRVRVCVPVGELERARSEVRRLDEAAAPRVRSLTRDVQLALLGATAAGAALAVALLPLGVRSALGGGAGLWLAWLALWVVRSRLRAAAEAP